MSISMMVLDDRYKHAEQQFNDLKANGLVAGRFRGARYGSIDRVIFPSHHSILSTGEIKTNPSPASDWQACALLYS
jgi:hypothetical protein